MVVLPAVGDHQPAAHQRDQISADPHQHQGRPAQSLPIAETAPIAPGQPQAKEKFSRGGPPQVEAQGLQQQKQGQRPQLVQNLVSSGAVQHTDPAQQSQHAEIQEGAQYEI